MTSEVEICNLALTTVRGGSINSLNEASIQAQNCKLLYPTARDMLLRVAPWQFAHKVKPLALLTDDLFNWIYTYQYPSDCLQINRLIINFEAVSSDNTTSAVASRFYDPGLPLPNLTPQVEYELQNIDGNRVIATNERDARISYRAKITDPNLFDSEFVLMFSYLLGSFLAIPIVGAKTGRELRSDNFQIYQSMLASAIASDLNEQFHPTPDSDYVSIRN